jgi:hypothetical protein
MVRRYSSYLVRCWTTPDTERVEIQLLPSSQRAHFTSLKSALEWLETCNEQVASSEADTEQRFPCAFIQAPSALA